MNLGISPELIARAKVLDRKSSEPSSVGDGLTRIAPAETVLLRIPNKSGAKNPKRIIAQTAGGDKELSYSAGSKIQVATVPNRTRKIASLHASNTGSLNWQPGPTDQYSQFFTGPQELLEKSIAKKNTSH